MRTKKGIITSDKQNKTVVVTVIAYKIHPKYKKKYQVSKKFYAHDEENAAKLGDTVIIEETKPQSKLKRWKIVENLGGSNNNL